MLLRKSSISQRFCDSKTRSLAKYFFSFRNSILYQIFEVIESLSSLKYFLILKLKLLKSNTLCFKILSSCQFLCAFKPQDFYCKALALDKNSVLVKLELLTNILWFGKSSFCEISGLQILSFFQIVFASKTSSLCLIFFTLKLKLMSNILCFWYLNF